MSDARDLEKRADNLANAYSAQSLEMRKLREKCDALQRFKDTLRARVEGLTSPTAAMRSKDRTEEDSVFADGYERCRADFLALLDTGEEEPVTEEWLRTRIGFKDKQYQGQKVLALSITNACTDTQWIELESIERGMFIICRWSPMYDDDTPPDRVEVVARTKQKLIDLLAALGISLQATQ